jgi:hypothetical protein
MDDSKDISFSNLTDTISVQGYDYQTIDLSTIDLSSSITMASPTYTMSPMAPNISTISLSGPNVTPTWSIGSNTITGLNGISAVDIKPSGTITLKGDDADIDINGKSLMKTLEALEDRLNMMVPNPELEKEWDDLKKLGDRYRKLEAKCKEKAKMWNKLKSMPKPNIKL